MFLICTGSISWIIVKSKIFKSLRERFTTTYLKADKDDILYGFYYYISHVFNCVGCCGVYSAFAAYLILYQKFSVEMIAYCLAGSMISLILNKHT